MKIKYGAVMLAVAALLAGCSGFWTAPKSSTSSSDVFYVLNQTTKQIAAYTISSSALNAVSGSPYALAAAPYSIAIAPGGGFLYVGTVGGIYVYAIGTGGVLSILNNGDAISSDFPLAMEVGPNGSWLIDAFINASGQVQLDAIPINSSGTYTAGANVPSVAFTITNATVNQMALSPDGTNLFVAMGAGGTAVVPFTYTSSSPLGAIARVIDLFNSSGAALSVAVDPTNRLFYVGETLANSSADSGGLRVFNYSSLGTGTPRSVPSEITGSPIASGGLSPSAILPIASGGYVYVANGHGTGSGNIGWFPISVSGTTYSISSGSSVTCGILPAGLAEDSTNQFVLAVSAGENTSAGGDPDLETFTMSSGALTVTNSTATGTDPVGAIAVAALP
jgi:hypothetical protein